MMNCLDHLSAIFLVTCLVTADDLPCSPRDGDPGQGQICVCNSTYCDTIEQPSRLPVGQYHLYTTSNSTLGFTQTTGNFTYDLKNDQDYDVMFKINNSVVYQEIIGVGGSFTDSAGMVISSLPDAAQDKLIESYFGTSGIEYSLGRAPIGGTDFSEQAYYSLDNVMYDQYLYDFSLNREDYAYKIPFIKKALALSERGIKIFSCAWSSPQWMKTNYDQPQGTAGYIKEKYLQAYAQYHVKFLEEYKRNGIDIWAISGGNEVVFGIFKRLNCTQQLAQVQRDWLKRYLAPALRSANFSDVKFLGLEDLRMFAVYWMDRFAYDPEAYKLSSGIALHWYYDYLTPPHLLDVYHDKYPDQMIVYTESSLNPHIFAGPDEAVVVLGSWGRAALYMHSIIENLNHWTNGYIDWNLAVDMEGGPFQVFGMDAAVIVNNVTGEFYKQPLFYALGHFSKFIPPGSNRVYSGSDCIKKEYNSYKEYNTPIEEPSQDHERVERLNTVNMSKRPVTAPEIVECVATSNSDGSNTIIVLNNKNTTSRVKLDIANVGSVTINLEEKSLNTFVYWI